ncbi:MAG: hypothetical protein ACHP7P_14605 [Terriglobales bacterium]
MVGLCLVAVFAIAAVAATSASALPEWGKCEKLGTKTGAYTDANCTIKAKPVNTGEFKWRKGKELAPLKFSGNNVGSGGVLTAALEACYDSEFNTYRTTRAKCAEKGGTRVPEGTIAIECESENNTGEELGTNLLANVSVKFHGCKMFGSLPCSNGTEPGEIAVNTLKGSLGYLPGKQVGVLLTPAKAKGDFATFICGGVITTVVGVGNTKEGAYYEPEKTGGYDGIISPITPVNTMSTKSTQVYTVNPGTDENIPSKFVVGHIDLLETFTYNTEEPKQTFMWSRAGEEITNENTAGEAREIKG